MCEMLTEVGFPLELEDIFEVFVGFAEPGSDVDGTTVTEGHYYFCAEKTNGEYVEIPEDEELYTRFVELFGLKEALDEIDDLGDLRLMIYEKDGEASEYERTAEDIQELFKQNLRYISQTEIDAAAIEGQFVKTQSRFYLTVGEIDCPTGHLIVSDPLYYLAADTMCPQLALSIPAGTYPVEVSLYRDSSVGIRMCTARLKIKNTKAVRYTCAEPTEESAVDKAVDGLITGFPVEAGMMSFCDVQTAKEYRHFLTAWHSEHKGKNHYDDYFAPFFAESEKERPAYQREGGDFIEWTNPDSGNRMVMISSGFGDGFYQSHWGYDDQDELCELIVPMINPDLFE
jgi:hypothetical protein